MKKLLSEIIKENNIIIDGLDLKIEIKLQNHLSKFDKSLYSRYCNDDDLSDDEIEKIENYKSKLPETKRINSIINKYEEYVRFYQGDVITPEGIVQCIEKTLKYYELI